MAQNILSMDYKSVFRTVKAGAADINLRCFRENFGFVRGKSLERFLRRCQLNFPDFSLSTNEQKTIDL
jgi:hypothetical protein